MAPIWSRVTSCSGREETGCRGGPRGLSPAGDDSTLSAATSMRNLSSSTRTASKSAAVAGCLPRSDNIVETPILLEIRASILNINLYSTKYNSSFRVDVRTTWRCRNSSRDQDAKTVVFLFQYRSHDNGLPIDFWVYLEHDVLSPRCMHKPCTTRPRRVWLESRIRLHCPMGFCRELRDVSLLKRSRQRFVSREVKS